MEHRCCCANAPSGRVVGIEIPGCMPALIFATNALGASTTVGMEHGSLRRICSDENSAAREQMQRGRKRRRISIPVR